jgi:hypothetical protein
LSGTAEAGGVDILFFISSQGFSIYTDILKNVGMPLQKIHGRAGCRAWN